MSRSLALFALLFAAPALAVPLHIPHQGRLVGSDGIALEGEQTVTFRLFAAAEGGDALWEGTEALTLTNGYYATALGGEAGVSAELLAANESLFLEIQVGDGAAAPRLPVQSVPYAIVAGWAATADSAKNVAGGGTIDASSLTINGTTVIGSDGLIPAAQISGLVDSDTLDDLACDDGQIPTFSGGAWSCGDAEATTDAADILTGTFAIERLPVGSTSGSVAAGDHQHDAAAITSGTLDIARIPVGTTSGTVAAGDHKHSAADITSGTLDKARLPTLTAADVGAIAAGSSVPHGNDTATCNSAKAGAVRWSGTALQVCNGATWATVSIVTTDGSGDTRAAASCKVLLDQLPGAASGIYWLDPDGSGGQAPFQAYCDMTTAGGGWTLTFKKSAGAAGEPQTLWTTVTNPTATALMDRDKEAQNYTNIISTQHWGRFTEARVELITNGSAVKFIQFNLVGSNNVNWYERARVTSSSWTDLTSATQNHFSIAGEAQAGYRDFFINSSYGGCPGDIGWVIVSGSVTACSWEEVQTIRYINATTTQNWNGAERRDADAFAVFVR